MTSKLQQMISALGLLGVVFMLPNAVHASLVGTTVSCTNVDAFISCAPSSATVGAGSEFTISSGTQGWSADLDASSILIARVGGPGTISDPTPRRIQFGDLFTAPVEITGFTLTTVGSNLSSSAITFDAHSVTVNFASTSWAEGSSASIALETVPIPAAVWLFGSGLIGLVGVARRKAA